MVQSPSEVTCSVEASLKALMPNAVAPSYEPISLTKRSPVD